MCLPLVKTWLKEELETGQSRDIVVECVVPATALSVKLSRLRLQSIMRRCSAVLPNVGRIINVLRSMVPSSLLSYTNTQPVATFLSLTVHDILSAHWPPAEISWTWYPWMWLTAEQIETWTYYIVRKTYCLYTGWFGNSLRHILWLLAIASAWL